MLGGCSYLEALDVITGKTIFSRYVGDTTTKNQARYTDLLESSTDNDLPLLGRLLVHRIPAGTRTDLEDLVVLSELNSPHILERKENAILDGVEAPRHVSAALNRKLRAVLEHRLETSGNLLLGGGEEDTRGVKRGTAIEEVVVGHEVLEGAIVLQKVGEERGELSAGLCGACSGGVAKSKEGREKEELHDGV